MRYRGLFPGRWKSKYLLRARRALGQDEAAEHALRSAAVETETPLSLASWRERRRARGADPLRCPECHGPMVLREVAFGPHDRIERLFRQAGRPVKSFHPAYAMPP